MRGYSDPYRAKVTDRVVNALTFQAGEKTAKAHTTPRMSAKMHRYDEETMPALIHFLREPRHAPLAMVYKRAANDDDGLRPYVFYAGAGRTLAACSFVPSGLST
jgi:hypothetical protein